MNLHAIYHKQKSNYAYAYSNKELHIRLRTAKNDCKSVMLIISQKHNWGKKQKFKMRKIASDMLYDYYQYEYITDDSRLGYYFEIENGDNKIIYSESGFSQEFDDENAYFHYFQFPYINDVDVHHVPSWVNETVFYQIFVDRFYNGDKDNDSKYTQPWGTQPESKSFYGGDLKGIIDKLDYLKELGINGIYLTPIFESPSNHKYDTVNYRKIDPMFGDTQIFKELVDLAHKKNIRIIIDGVFNHCSWCFGPFEDVMKYGKESSYKDWFLIKSFPLKTYSKEEVYDYSVPMDLSELNYRVFGTSPNMPKLNTSNPEVRRYILDTVTYWMKETNIDGWRLDVADEVSHDFWRDFRKTVKGINPDALIVGENWHNAYPWLIGDQFDGVMNYTLTKSFIQFFALNEIDGEHFSSDLTKYLMWNSRQVQDAMLNLLDSHDTMRFLTWCKKDIRLLKMAVMLMFSYVGMPCIYYGSEIGMNGGGDPDCRRTFDWNENHWNQELFQFYKNIIKLRRTEKALKYGEINIESKDDVIFLTRSSQDEMIITIINNTNNNKYIKLLNQGTCLISTEELEEDNKLPPFSGVIIKVIA